MRINYPKSLHLIFLKLIQHNIKPIIVGGYIRDSLLRRTSHDIDIELYNIDSFEYVEKILQEFGSVNSVGKSFGICKLKYRDLELDFSLPRTDSKIASGHQGFQIEVDTSLNFTQASSRRDFTINAMGYDIKAKKLLDPFGGREDLNKKELKAVDLKKFDEDPLRVLRAIMFSARFEFSLESSLFIKCKSMMQANVLKELAQERIFEEIKKILLQSKKPPQGFLLLKHLDGFIFFNEFTLLSEEKYFDILKSLDIFKQYYFTEDEEKNIIVMFALLSSKFTLTAQKSFLSRVTKNKKLINTIEKLTQTQLRLEDLHNYDIYKLATKVDISLYSCYLYAFYQNNKKREIDNLITQAKRLGVFHKKAEPFIKGRELLGFGLQPSALFSKILNDTYEAQMHEKFKNRDEALIWVQNYLGLKDTFLEHNQD